MKFVDVNKAEICNKDRRISFIDQNSLSKERMKDLEV